MRDMTQRKNVVVLTDSPWDYDAVMRRLSLIPLYAPSTALLLESLLGKPASGFVLEVGKVMRASDPGRDQIFQLARVFPVLRVLRRGAGRDVAFMDDQEDFAARVRAFSPRQVRQSGRVPVMLSGSLAAGDDLAFADPVPANILDVSGGGGFVSSLKDFGVENSVRLRIEDIADRTPILAEIRWRKGEARASARNGFGLHFLDIRPGQLRELVARFLIPQFGPTAAQASG